MGYRSLVSLGESLRRAERFKQKEQRRKLRKLRGKRCR